MSSTGELRVDDLPPSFLHFLQSNGVDEPRFRREVAAARRNPRYVRLRPFNVASGAALATVATLTPRARAIACEVERQVKEHNPTLRGTAPGTLLAPVPWLPRFFAMPAAARVQRCACYRGGALQCMDAASGWAVRVLDPRPGEHVLDLCAAPGAKATLIADRMATLSAADGSGGGVRRRGSLTLVDASAPRLRVCVRLAERAALHRAWPLPLSFAGGPARAPGSAGGARKRYYALRDQADARATESGDAGEDPYPAGGNLPPNGGRARWLCRMFHADARRGFRGAFFSLPFGAGRRFAACSSAAFYQPSTLIVLRLAPCFHNDRARRSMCARESRSAPAKLSPVQVCHWAAER